MNRRIIDDLTMGSQSQEPPRDQPDPQRVTEHIHISGTIAAMHDSLKRLDAELQRKVDEIAAKNQEINSIAHDCDIHATAHHLCKDIAEGKFDKDPKPQKVIDAFYPYGNYHDYTDAQMAVRNLFQEKHIAERQLRDAKQIIDGLTSGNEILKTEINGQKSEIEKLNSNSNIVIKERDEAMQSACEIEGYYEKRLENLQKKVRKLQRQNRKK